MEIKRKRYKLFITVILLIRVITPEEIPEAVLKLLNDDEWVKWPNNRIAEVCGVSLDLVNRMRNELSLNDSLSDKQRTFVTRWGTVATMNTERIGKTANISQQIISRLISFGYI